MSFRLSQDSVRGTYQVQIESWNNLTGQVGHSSTTLMIIGPAKKGSGLTAAKDNTVQQVQLGSSETANAAPPPVANPAEVQGRIEASTKSAQTFFLERDYEAALRTCNQGLALEPRNNDLQQLRTNIQQTMQILGIQPGQMVPQQQDKAVGAKLTRLFTHDTGAFRELHDGTWEEVAPDGRYDFVVGQTSREYV